MSNILILGGGFGGVVAAESLAKQISDDHQITLISRSRDFIFYPDLVRVAFGKCEPSDISFDLRDAMLNRRVRFVQAEVARVDPDARQVIIQGGDLQGKMPYDFLIYALGRRLATEQITGFFEHADHILTVEAALEFGEKIKKFKEGRAIIGQCPSARLPVPAYETAFALSRVLKPGDNSPAHITIVSPDPPNLPFGDPDMARALRTALEEHSIEYLPDFPIKKVTPTTVVTSSGHSLTYKLLMLIPPFRGSGAVTGLPIIDGEGYINVERTMRVKGYDCFYAVGDCVNFNGPKLGHMAVHQAEIAAHNIALELRGKEPDAYYEHELMLVIDEGGGETIYLHKGMWDGRPSSVRQSRFWKWAKHIHEKFWLAQHS